MSYGRPVADGADITTGKLGALLLYDWGYSCRVRAYHTGNIGYLNATHIRGAAPADRRRAGELRNCRHRPGEAQGQLAEAVRLDLPGSERALSQAWANLRLKQTRQRQLLVGGVPLGCLGIASYAGGSGTRCDRPPNGIRNQAI